MTVEQRDLSTDRLRAAMRRRLRLARLAVAWESLWPAIWPAVGVVGLFVALALLDVLPLLPPWLHALLLAGFATAFGTAVWRGLSRFSWPGDAVARRRVERDSGLAHRPLAVLDDRLAGSQRDPVARALWEAHRKRMAALVRRLRVAPPSPGMAARDPLGLRAAVLLLLVIAGAGAWNQDVVARLERAVSPQVPIAPAEHLLLQVWVTPPAHTGMPPVFLESPSARPEVTVVSAPVGSSILALLQGGDGEASLEIGETVTPFAAVGADSQRVETRLSAGDSLRVRQDGATVAEWPLSVVQDGLPAIAFVEPPGPDQRSRLVLAYEARDDFGVAKAQAVIRPFGRPEEQPLVVEMYPGGTPAKELRQASRQDLTAHPWAGMPVTVTPVAEDTAGQRGAGEAAEIILPERVFTHPVARAIIAERRKLFSGSQTVPEVVAGLDAIASQPHAFDHDTVVFLSLRVARARLYRGLRSDAAIAQTSEILWQTALRIEEGGRAAAERLLADTMQELEQALERGASAEEIERLMQQLRQAMEQFLQAMAEQAMRNGAQPMPMDPNMETITGAELQEMMEQMGDLAKVGARDAARQMLSELRNMLENLQMAGQPGQMSEQMRQASEAMNQLGEMARRQRELMDDSFRRAERPEAGDPAANQAGAQSQDELRRQLGEAMRRIGESLGEIPGELGAAEQAMREAIGELGRNAPGQAAQSQGEALQQLQAGMQSAMQSMAQQMGQGGQGYTGMQNGNGMRRDPLGRRLPNGLADDRSVHVPDEAEIHKAREVLEELRRRAGQPQRPREEREYLDRLLRQF